VQSSQEPLLSPQFTCTPRVELALPEIGLDRLIICEAGILRNALKLESVSVSGGRSRQNHRAEGSRSGRCNTLRIGNEFSNCGGHLAPARLFFAQRYYTETTDLDQIEAQSPADLIAQAIMVGYHDILPYAAPLEVSLNGRSWLFDDQYCVRPKCPCQEATITFHPLATRNEAGTKPPTELPETPSCISVCYH